jgi:hypothetical protein
MRSSAVVHGLVLVLAAASCLKPSGQTSSSSPDGASAASSSNVLVSPPSIAALPAASALVASFDLAKLTDAKVLDMLGAKQSELEKALGLTHGESGADLLAALGIDPARPVELAQLVIGEQAKKAVVDLEALTPSKEPVAHGQPGEVQPEGLFEPARKALAAIPALGSYRIIVPAKDLGRLRSSLDTMLKAGGLKPGPSGEYSSRHVLVVVGVAPEAAVVDVIAGDGAREGLETLRAEARAHPVDPPPLGDAAFAVHYSPEREAEIGFLTGAMTAAGAVSGASIDPKMRERILADGLWEASQNLALATGPKGARFTEVDVTGQVGGGHATLTMRAEPGPGYDGPDGDVWSPSFAVQPTAPAPGPGRGFDVSSPFLDGWKIPNPAGHTGLDTKSFGRSLSGAGVSGRLVALPEMSSVLAPAMDVDGLTPSEPVLKRLARFGVWTLGGATKPKDGAASPPPGRLFIGLLPDGTSKAAAACVLVGPAPCAKGLALGAVAKDPDAKQGDRFATLVQVDGHFALLRATSKEALAPQRVKALALKGAPAGPVVVHLDVAAMLGPEAGSVAAGMVGTVHRDGRTVIVELSSP